MIRPDQVKPVGTTPAKHEHDLETLEKLCDEAIRRADVNQKWPAPVPFVRQIFGRQAISETITRYRDAGWIVLAAALGESCYMTIDRPAK